MVPARRDPRRRLPSAPFLLVVSQFMKRADFLGLGRQCAELLPPIGRLQFHHLGEVLSARQALGQVEAGI